MNEIQVNYYISADANIRKSFEFDSVRNSIGNSFPTSEEAEKTVEKLRAWKRLKDKGFQWRYYAMGDGDKFRAYFSIKDGADIGADLDLLFSEEGN